MFIDEQDEYGRTLEEEGICIIDDVFDPIEIRKLFLALKEIFRRTRKTRLNLDPSRNIANCCSLAPELLWIVHHEKLLEVVKRALDSEDIMYTSILGIQRNVISSSHKDDGISGRGVTGYFEKSPYGDEMCKVVRVAIYLRAHKFGLTSLGFRRRSHLTSRLDYGEPVTMRNRLGRAVIFDVRLTHWGTRRSIIFRKIDALVHPKYRKYLVLMSSFFRSIFLLLPGRNKYAVFLAYGLVNRNTVNYSKNMMRNQKKVSGGDFRVPTTLRDILLEKNVVCASDYFKVEDFESDY